MRWRPVLFSGIVAATTVFATGASVAQDQATADNDRRFSHIIDPAHRLRVYQLHQVSALYRACDKRRVGVLECSIDEIARIEQARLAGSERTVRSNTPIKRAAATPKAAPKQNEPLPDVPKVPLPLTSTITPFLRHDMPDISLFSQMKPAKNAKGAEVSFTRDYASHNDLWTVDGIAGFAYQVIGDYASDPDRPSLLAGYIAPYVQVDKSFNTAFSKRPSNTDTASVGLKAEAGIDNLLGGQQYF